MNTENNLSNTVKIANTDDILLGTPEITRTASFVNWGGIVKAGGALIGGTVGGAAGGIVGGGIGLLVGGPPGAAAGAAAGTKAGRALGAAGGAQAATAIRNTAISGGFSGTMQTARYYPSTKTTNTTNTTNTTTDILTGMDVMRFNDQQTGAHFFTTNSSEIQDRLNNPSRYQSEGNEFDTPLANAPGAIPVYRYFNQQSQTYFYTIQPPNELIAQFPVFSNDGIAFYAYKNSQSAPAGSVPIHRFYNQEASNRAGSPVHFFTGTEQNKQAVQGLAGFDYEGAGFYAYPSDLGSKISNIVSSTANSVANSIANISSRFF